MEFQRCLQNSVWVLFRATNAFYSINGNNELALRYSLMEFGGLFWKTVYYTALVLAFVYEAVRHSCVRRVILESKL